MIGLAAIPSSSVALVVVRSATRNVPNGIAAALGIVTGDLIFVLMAILGLSALSEATGAFFAIIRYIAAGYLIWFGIGLVRSLSLPGPRKTETAKGGLVASFVSGLALTLGDIKAILFYASLFPTFVDMALLETSDIVTITAITLFAVGGIKIAYAFAAKAVVSSSRGFVYGRFVRAGTGGLMIGAGTYFVVKT
ncbi:LysE family translocator [Exilibacterium tricleocarpae]|uniref:LysE family translocator n=2 Tax=Exilibacterium tricleocarpae TaxID=2591008 RepID=A0A545T054_9GAMM|nr:LysE family translocator [Exilibacterium tricleocarpae]